MQIARPILEYATPRQKPKRLGFSPTFILVHLSCPWLVTGATAAWITIANTRFQIVDMLSNWQPPQSALRDFLGFELPCIFAGLALCLSNIRLLRHLPRYGLRKRLELRYLIANEIAAIALLVVVLHNYQIWCHP